MIDFPVYHLIFFIIQVTHVTRILCQGTAPMAPNAGSKKFINTYRERDRDRDRDSWPVHTLVVCCAFLSWNYFADVESSTRDRCNQWHASCASLSGVRSRIWLHCHVHITRPRYSTCIPVKLQRATLASVASAIAWNSNFVVVSLRRSWPQLNCCLPLAAAGGVSDL